MVLPPMPATSSNSSETAPLDCWTADEKNKIMHNALGLINNQYVCWRNKEHNSYNLCCTRNKRTVTLGIVIFRNSMFPERGLQPSMQGQLRLVVLCAALKRKGKESFLYLTFCFSALDRIRLSPSVDAQHWMAYVPFNAKWPVSAQGRPYTPCRAGWPSEPLAAEVPLDTELSSWPAVQESRNPEREKRQNHLPAKSD